MIWSHNDYPWPHGKRAAACFSVDVDAMSPWLWQMRTSVPHTLAVSEHRQYGMRRGLARMVSMLDRLGIRGSFFVPGVVAEENPDLLPGLVARGHEIALHGYYHELAADITDNQFTEALERSIALFVEQTGQRPAGFRSPAWEMTPHMLAELRRLGLWDSSLMGHDLPYRIDGVTEVPVRWDNDDAIFFKFLGPADRVPQSAPQIGAAWAHEADVQIADGGLFMLTVHDWISGRAARVAMLETLWSSLAARDDLWIATCGEIAHHHDSCVGFETQTTPITPISARGGA